MDWGHVRGCPRGALAVFFSRVSDVRVAQPEGVVAEWFKAAVLKTAEPERVP